MTGKSILTLFLPTILLLGACAKSQQVPNPKQDIPIRTHTHHTLTPVTPATDSITSAHTPVSQPPGVTVQSPATTEISTQVPEPVRIQFKQGATVAKLEDSLTVGEKKRYILYALAGQTTRVYVEPFGFDLRIMGEDGTVLKNQDDHLAFWRGKLPATQEYFIEVTPRWEGPAGEEWVFVLSVLINPRGKAIQSWTYRDEEQGFELKYSDYFVASSPPPEIDLMKGNLVLCLTFVGSEYFESTNLAEVYFIVGSSKDTQIVSICLTPKSNYERVLGEEVVNSITFHKGAYGEGAAGNFYLEDIYRTLYKETCYEVVFHIHCWGLGGYDPGSGIKRFDEEAVLNKLREVLLTFKFIEQ